MALQGDLRSFALPEVLQLLAGTGKSGRLSIDGPEGTGELTFADGALAAGAASTAPRAQALPEVLHELLRFEQGAFAFEDGPADGTGDLVEVASALAEAETLLEQWRDVEETVPSMDAWISLAPELDGDGIELDADEWRSIAAIGSGGSVRDLADALGASDLVASQRTKQLVDRGLASVRASHVATEPVDPYVAPTIELDTFDHLEVEPEAEEVDVADVAMTDLEHLASEDRPVVMEDRDDAMLPEPLPGEGVAYAGETITGSVDGRSFETLEAFESYDLPETTEALEPFQHGTLETSVPGHLDHPIDGGEGDAAPFVPGAGPDSASRTSADDEVSGPEAVQDAPAPDVDDERGSLLRFLSTVKP